MNLETGNSYFSNVCACACACPCACVCEWVYERHYIRESVITKLKQHRRQIWLFRLRIK